METPHAAWPVVTPEELADARQYTIGIDWSPADEVYIASFPASLMCHSCGRMGHRAKRRSSGVKSSSSPG
jgi:hypothetical protein